MVGRSISRRAPRIGSKGGFTQQDRSAQFDSPNIEIALGDGFPGGWRRINGLHTYEEWHDYPAAVGYLDPPSR